VPVLN